MNFKITLLATLIGLSVFSSSTMAMEAVQKKPGLTIAVAGGGGVNAYASLYMAVKLAQAANAQFHELFDQFWGVSGGTIPATLLMSRKFVDEETLGLFKGTVNQAFPDLLEFLDPTDSLGTRRTRFEKELVGKFGDLSFGATKNNKFVYIASSDGLPVYFCDPEIELPSSALRCVEGTSCVKGIVGSSSFTTRVNLRFFATNVSLFKEEGHPLHPLNEIKIIRDGGHCFARHQDKHILDGFTPTPLVLDYLKTIPGHHRVVVFDNGGPTSKSFRQTIGVDEDGLATVEFDDGTINVHIISVIVENFETNAINKTPNHLEYLEAQVEEALSGNSATAFLTALTAVSKK